MDRDSDGRLSQQELEQLICELGINTAGQVAAEQAGEVMRELTSADPQLGITFEQFAEFHHKVVVGCGLWVVDCGLWIVVCGGGGGGGLLLWWWIVVALLACTYAVCKHHHDHHTPPHHHSLHR